MSTAASALKEMREATERIDDGRKHMRAIKNRRMRQLELIAGELEGLTAQVHMLQQRLDAEKATHAITQRRLSIARHYASCCGIRTDAMDRLAENDLPVLQRAEQYAAKRRRLDGIELHNGIRSGRKAYINPQEMAEQAIEFARQRMHMEQLQRWHRTINPDLITWFIPHAH